MSCDGGFVLDGRSVVGVGGCTLAKEIWGIGS
jgi:hypothetical protein